MLRVLEPAVVLGAGPGANEKGFDGVTEILAQVPAVADLRGQGSPLRGTIDIHRSTIPAHDLYIRVSSKPDRHAGCFPVRQQINNLARFQVYDDTAITLPAPIAPVINAEDRDLADGRKREEIQGPEQSNIGELDA